MIRAVEIDCFNSLTLWQSAHAEAFYCRNINILAHEEVLKICSKPDRVKRATSSLSWTTSVSFLEIMTVSVQRFLCKISLTKLNNVLRLHSVVRPYSGLIWKPYCPQKASGMLRKWLQIGLEQTQSSREKVEFNQELVVPSLLQWEASIISKLPNIIIIQWYNNQSW